MIVFGWVVIAIGLGLGLMAWVLEVGYGGSANLHMLSNRQMALESAGFLLVSGSVFAALGHLAERIAPTRKVRLGTSLAPIDQKTAAKLGLPDTQGVLVTSVVQESIASRAGIIAGDVIRAFDGQRISHEGDLQKLVRHRPVGTNVAISLWRDRSEVSIVATF